MASSSGNVKLEIEREEKVKNKWSVALGEEVFKAYMKGGGVMVHKVFGEGSIFSPFLFGKFFDPSDAFPLWDFQSDVLLSNLRTSGLCKVDWFQTDLAYVLKAQLPENGKNKVKVYVEKGKVMEISGEWKQQTPQEVNNNNNNNDNSSNNNNNKNKKDWRSGRWWEYGFVRRLELPGDVDPSAADAYVSSDDLLEIRLPKEHDLRKPHS